MKKITPEELKEWQKKDKSFILIDVRETWEHTAFNIGGRNIPVGEVMLLRHEIPQTGDVVVYCEKGIRSSIVIQRLEGFGYHNLYNLTGGMTAWRAMIN
ncbi:MAG: rhodanese-like domain-containing protein [Sphingobacteriales bacterium]|nr:MAG: rhodanese-like domain-containing protein [Sphingobacteriales bacterium]